MVNTEVDYLSDPEKVEIIAGVPEALRRLHAAGYLAIVVTNQSGVARGMYAETDIHRVHERIQELLAPERIDAFYYCVHHPKHSEDCDCRKPAPGMLLRAAREHDIDPALSYMVGDRMSDLEAGVAAGCAGTVLVRTGYGEITIANGIPAGTVVAGDLLAAVELELGCV